MPRDGEKVRKGLQQAALRLFEKRGYEQTTAAEIAAEAGVTERTFFRHFSDKRDVLFGGDAALSEVLTQAIRSAPPGVGPWEVLLRAFRSAEPLFVDARSFSEPRQRLIEKTPALQERALAKNRQLISVLVSGLRERGIDDRAAMLAAQMAMAAASYAVACWFEDGSRDLSDHFMQAFRKVHELSHSAKSVP